MAKCPRCDREVGELQVLTPDVISKDVINSIDQGEADLADGEGLKVCAECMIELRGN